MGLLNQLIQFAQSGNYQQAPLDLLTSLYLASQVPKDIPFVDNSRLDQLTAEGRIFGGLNTQDALEELVRNRIGARNIFGERQLIVPQKGFLQNLFDQLRQRQQGVTQTQTAPPLTLATATGAATTATAPTRGLEQVLAGMVQRDQTTGAAPIRPTAATGAPMPTRATPQQPLDQAQIDDINASIARFVADYIPRATGIYPTNQPVPNFRMPEVGGTT
jgi:hypothetical protein